MKKTIVALSVLVASSMANAGIEVYNKDGVSVDLTGDLEIFYKKPTTEDSDFEQHIDDADFGFDVRYAVNDQLSVGGYWEFSGVDGGKDKASGVNTGDAFFGFYMNDHAIRVGKMPTILDDTGVVSDYKFGITSFLEDVGFEGDEVVKYQFDNDVVYGGLAVMQNESGNKSFGDETYVDMNIGVRTEVGLDLSAWYGTVDELDFLALEARYAATDSLNLGAGFYDVSDLASSYVLGADYTVEKMTYAVGVSLTDREVGDDEVHGFVNAGYAIAPATTLYAELGMNDLDNSELGYGVGMKLEF